MRADRLGEMKPELSAFRVCSKASLVYPAEGRTSTTTPPACSALAVAGPIAATLQLPVNPTGN